MAGIAQDLKEIPALKRGLTHVKNDSSKVEYLWKIAFHYSQVYPDSGLPFAKEAIQISKETRNDTGLAESSNIAGLCLSNSGFYEESESYFKIAVMLFKKIGDPCLTAAAIGNRGWNDYHQHNYAKALSQFFEAEQLERECPSRGWKSTTYYNIGVAYNALKEFDKALPYFEQAIRADLQTQDSIKLATSLQGKANALRDLNRLDEARKHYKLAINLYSRLTDRYAEAYAYENLAELELEEKNFSVSLMYAGMALNIFEMLHRKPDQQYEHNLLARILLQSDALDQSLVHAKKSYQLASELQDPYARRDAYALLSTIHEKSANYKDALTSQRLENLLRDSLDGAEQQKTIAELATKFETEKKDRLIERERMLIDEAKQAEREALQQKRLWLVSAIAALLLSLAIGLLLYFSRRTSSLLQKKNLQIAREKENAQRSEEAKQVFLSTMSHELRNPLSAIIGILRLVNTNKLEPKDLNYLTTLRSLGGHMHGIVDDILNSAQLDAGYLPVQVIAFKPKEALASFEKIYEALAKEKGIHFSCICDFQDHLILKGDKSRWLQILHNLLSNALKFTQEGQILLSVHYSDKHLKSTVKDDGPGIPEDFRRQLFEPFQQQKESVGSSGLGLSISKRIAQLLGGQINVLKDDSKGAHFEVDLPMEETYLISNDTNKPEIPIFSETKGDVIVVEDDPYAWMVARDTIKKYFPALNLYHFSSAKDALNELESDTYDLVFTDIHLPGMSGKDLVEVLRSLKITLPVYAFTASLVGNETKDYLDLGFTGVIPKPFNEDQLVEPILKHIPGDSKNSSHNEDIFFEVEKDIQMFIHYLKPSVEILGTAIQSNDCQTIRYIAHKIRPLLTDFNYEKLAEKSFILESLEEDNEVLILEAKQMHSELSVILN